MIEIIIININDIKDFHFEIIIKLKIKGKKIFLKK